MSSTQVKASLAGALALALVLLSATTSYAAISTKLLFSAELGFEVNKTTKGIFCPVASGDECAPEGGESSGPGGFEGDVSVATDPTTGNVYVADYKHKRIQEFASNGAFVLMLGAKVNKTTNGDVCTAAEEASCQEGEAGSGLAGQAYGPQDVAVDPSTGNVYVLELYHKRVEEFTPAGEFVLMIGGEVNKTASEKGGSEAERNLCTKASGDTCQAGELVPTGPGKGAFREYPKQFAGDLLSVGGSEHLLYVADRDRIQEFTPAGEWKGEIPLTAIGLSVKPSAIAVNAAGDVYLSAIASEPPYEQIGGIHALDGKGVEIAGYAQSDAGKIKAEVGALALDPGTGRLAARESEGATSRGSLYGEEGLFLTTFAPPGGMDPVEGMSFNSSDELLIADDGRRDVEFFEPAAVPEAITQACKNTTTTAITLTGEVDPKEVAETRAWFEYGPTSAFGHSTPRHPIAEGNAFGPFEATVENLLPNETYEYRLEAEGKTDPHEPGEGKTLSCATKLAPPEVEGEPEAADVTFSTASLFGSLNPENAETEYYFQYATKPLDEYASCNEADEEPGSCPARTAQLKSSAYASIDAALSLSELQPSTLYYYRLVAANHSRDLKEEHRVNGAEASFVTPSAPNPTATTAPASAVTATTATLNGSVDPDGPGATYAFELGVYNSAGTVYSAVVQGPTGEHAGAIAESFTLKGLLPGVTYAFRISIAGAYESGGQPVRGSTQLFTTSSLPVVVQAPTVLPMLAAPPIAFPHAIEHKRLTNAQKLALALQRCRKVAKRRRATCERSAHKRYPTKDKATARHKRPQ